MKKVNKRKMANDLRPEYDLSKLKRGVRGKYAKNSQQGTNLVLKPISHTDKGAKDKVNEFCNQVFWLVKVRDIFAKLFENEQSKVLMEKTAPSFFRDLNRILHGYLLLECAKITDRAKTYGKENLTIDNLIESIEWPPDVQEELKSLSNKTKRFREHILPARHQLCAHTDKETVLAHRRLGEFPKGEDQEFLNNLQSFCDVIYKACFGTILGEIVTTRRGDVIDFKGTLEKAIAFDELLSESSGQEKRRLYSYLEKVRHSRMSVKGEATREGSL